LPAIRVDPSLTRNRKDADGATARREVSFANGFAQVAEVELPPRTHDHCGRITTLSAPDGGESHHSERNRLPAIRVDPSLTRNRKDARWSI